MYRRKRDRNNSSTGGGAGDSQSGMSSSSIGGGGGGGDSVSTAGMDAFLAQQQQAHGAAAARASSPAAAAHVVNFAPNSDNHSVFSSSQVSKGNNSLAFDVNSMSAACSRERPRKKQRLEHMFLQDFSLSGVPDQIVPKVNFQLDDHHNNNNTIKRTLTGDSSTTNMGPPQQDAVNSFKRLRQAADVDIDDNSQLTASDVEDATSVNTGMGMMGDDNSEHRVIVHTKAMDEGDEILKEGQDDDDDSTEIEKAQRQAMFDYVLGRRQSQQAPGDSTAESSPVDRKIQGLFRQSLQNVQKGTHPLQVRTTDSDSLSQDDMAIDYSSILETTGNMPPPQQQQQPPRRERSNSLPDSMECVLDTSDYAYPAGWNNSGNANPAVPPIPQHALGGVPGNSSMTTTTNDVDMD